MARTWFGEIGPCCCLPPLLNLPAAFSQPRANHKGVPSIVACMVYLDDGIVLAVLLEPLLDELDHDADEPDDGDDEGAGGQFN